MCNKKICMPITMVNKKFLEFKNLQYDIVNKNFFTSSKYFRIINNLNGKFVSGNLTVVLGHKGCGKSEFFNLLTGYINKKDKTNGIVLYDNKERNVKEWMNIVSYLPQDNICFLRLTLLETLNYYSEFYNINLKERSIFLDKILKDCHIFYKKDMSIDSLSFSERKRAMLCIAMLSKPEILFLDKFLTGLDSYNALLTIDSLKRYAKDLNAIVLLSANQLEEGYFYLFDDLLYLTWKGIFYQGNIFKLKKWFFDNKIKKPDEISLVEFMYKITSKDNVIDEAKNSCNNVKENLNTNKTYIIHEKTKQCNNSFAVATWKINFKHIKILLYRNFILYYRSGLFWFAIFFRMIFLNLYFFLFTINESNIFMKKSKNNKDILLTQFLKNSNDYEINANYLCSYFIFTKLFLIVIIYFVTLDDFYIFDEKIYNYEIKTSKYSPISYAVFKLINCFLKNTIFILLYVMIVSFYLIQYNLQWKFYFYLFTFSLIYSIFYNIFILFLRVLPLNNMIMSVLFLLFCSYNEMNFFLKNLFLRFPILRFVKIVYLLFPHYNLNSFLFFDMYSMIKNNKILFKRSHKDSFVKTFFNILESIDSFRYANLSFDKKNCIKLFFFKDIWIEKTTYIIYLIFSILIYIILFIIFWILRKTPYIRLKLKN